MFETSPTQQCDAWLETNSHRRRGPSHQHAFTILNTASASNEVTAANPTQPERLAIRRNARSESVVDSQPNGSDLHPSSLDRRQRRMTISSSGANETLSAGDPATPYYRGGFDILRAFQLVGMRDRPMVNIGAVDLSCSFVACDATLDDWPIVYASTGFTHLTGYSQEEILGRNCRFLQARNGQLEAGAERPGMDRNMLFWLKQAVRDRREAQCYLVNYRKGGIPFINMMSLVPIPWHTSETRYIIGFQADVTETFRALTGRQLDFRHPNNLQTRVRHRVSRPEPPRRLLSHDSTSQTRLEEGQDTQDLAKLAIENADDVIYVLSLSGNFVYVSPSCRPVLEYDPTDLIGRPLAEICHPSDAAPVLRELRQATVGTSISFICRVRRKRSGYAWFECHGSRSAEWGSRQQFFILTARQRPQLTLSRAVLAASGGLRDGDLWSKTSVTGIFLFISANAEALLGHEPEHLVGTRIQDLDPSQSRSDLEHCMAQAAKGNPSSCQHMVRNRQERILPARTSFYCGELSDILKPAFLLAQTRVMTKPRRPRRVPATPSGAQGSDQNTQRDGNSADDDIFHDLRATSSINWQFEAIHLERSNRVLANELAELLANRKRINRNKLAGNLLKDCANCHTKTSPEWRRGPSGQKDLCNRCGLRWAKQRKE